MPPIPRRKAPGGHGTSDTTDTAAPRRSPRTAADVPPPPSGASASAGDSPPRAKPGPGTRSGGPRPQLQKSLEELFSAPAYVYAINGDQWAQDHITENAPRLAEAWYKLAQKNPAVKRTLESLTTGSAWGGVAVATGATLLPLMAHHQVLPSPVQAIFSGVPTTGTPRGPIVPPPPTPPPPGVTGGGGAPKSPPRAARPLVPPVGGPMTAPVAPGAPPGVVTVAASNNRATMVD